MTQNNKVPLFGPSPDEVPLKNAPLVRVLCQVRFPQILKISNEEFFADCHERLREKYPSLRQENLSSIVVDDDSPTIKVQKRWRMDDPDKWRVFVANDFVTLETENYTSRTDFFKRLEYILVVFSETIRPNFVSRVGVRYVNRIEGKYLDNIKDFVSDELVGATTGKLQHGLRNSMSEVECNVEEGQAMIRWGWPPMNATHEPTVLPPLPAKSWMLDIDVYRGFADAEQAFDGAELAAFAKKLGTREYAIFRWAVENKFLEAYGGKP